MHFLGNKWASWFNQDTLDEGWTLLRALAGEKLSFQQVPARLDPALIDQLDAWENEWLLVAEVSLRRHHPEVADKVFLNLSRTRGPEVAVSVATFLARVATLQEGDEQEQVAYALLVERGLTSEIIDHAQSLLDAIGAVKELPEPVTDKEKIAAAERAMWSWYREWSSIARITIQDGRLLRSLGFGTRRRNDTPPAEVAGEAEASATDEQPTADAPMQIPA